MTNYQSPALHTQNLEDSVSKRYKIRQTKNSNYFSEINTATTYENLKRLGIETKQKSKTFSPQKTLRYCLSPHPNIQIWHKYSPKNESYNPLTESSLNQQLSEINTTLEPLFHSNLLTLDSLEAPIFAKENNYKDKIKTDIQKAFAKKWAEGTYLDIPELFPTARKLERTITIFAGPTSCGKTYNAFELLKTAREGQYLAPLRLNALEAYEELNSSGVACNLITGEEKLEIDGATHQASTAEMAKFGKETGVTVVDEAQFMDDKERGWAFCNAIIGAPSKHIIVTCPEYAVEKIKRLASILGDQVNEFILPRKTKLSMTEEPAFNLAKIEPATAIVTFSRRRVFELKNEIERHSKVAIVYGAMPPEVRREQARRFRDKEVDILIATDAIGIGLNLPIKHIIVDTIEKFDGERRRKLFQCEVLQVVGRAGRFNIYEEGFVSGRNWRDHKYIENCLSIPNQTMMKDKFSAKVPFELIEEYMALSGEKKLSVATEAIQERIQFDEKIYELSSVENIVENLKFIESYQLSIDLEDVWRIAHIPIEIELVEQTFVDCLLNVAGYGKEVKFSTQCLNQTFTSDLDKMFALEDLSNQLDCAQWFFNRYEEKYEKTFDSIIKKLKRRVNTAMNNTVQKM